MEQYRLHYDRLKEDESAEEELENLKEPTEIREKNVNEVIAPSVKIIGLFFSAQYCPPCLKMMDIVKDFYQEYNKSKKELEIVLVGCDKNEKEYINHVKSMPWLWSIPFDDQETIARLEDIAQAETIPKLSLILL